MKTVIQRVHKAAVRVQQKEIGTIKKGLLVLVGIKEGDTEKEAHWLIDKVLSLRIFEDNEGKMNKSVTDVGGSLLIVPNFTLYADASKGNRPGFGEAESPAKAKELYEKLVSMAEKSGSVTIATGEFGANMEVELINDGPVTIIIEK